ncbi:hypothetical protein J3R30DRAFT_3588576 [Lentinula aciculospora]|uniref:F-box domain-containing protein n=1 Tax=Lentinula aciculospora TaxID=153920 RepID=A0A9W9DEI6_9AGAR|nr:hypothetical protein J3R30DRAFT_3588576 [Lentinula aciculospora]
MNYSKPIHDVLAGTKRRKLPLSGDTLTEGKRKRARVTGRKFDLRTSKLQEIPLELVIEILSYVESYELLKLARISKGFRSLLMDRSSAFLWRRARTNAYSAPNPPSGWSEPAHAHLLFVKCCSFCNTRCEKVIWECQIRCCRKCSKTRFILSCQAMSKYRFLLEKHRMVSVVPRQSSTGHLFVEVLDRYTAELLDLRGNSEAIEQWISCKIEDYNNTKTHATVCAGWDTRRKHCEYIERETARRSRIEWIEGKALSEGWSLEIEVLRQKKGYIVGKLVSNTCIRKKDKNSLNEEDWQKIQPLILGSLQKQRMVFLEEAMTRRLLLLQKTFNKFRQIHFAYHNAICPSIGDLITMDGPIKKLLQTTPLNPDAASVDTQFCSATLFVEIFVTAEFAEFIQKWRIAKEMELFRILCNAVHSTSTGSDLCLATTIFRCNARGCGVALYYPEIFQHSCTTNYNFIAESNIQTFGQVADSHLGSTSSLLLVTNSSSSEVIGCITIGTQTYDCLKILDTKAWNHGGQRICFDNSASEIARRVLDNDPYLDPLTTMIQFIKAWNPTFCCKTCSCSLFFLFQFRHEEVEMHDIVIQWKNLFLGRVLRSDDLNTVNFRSNSWVYGSRCKFCHELWHPDALSVHLLSAHSECKVDGNWFMDLNSRFPV